MDNSSSHEVIQINKVAELVYYMQTNDTTLDNALAIFGISKPTYYKYISRVQKAQEELQIAQRDLELMEYADIIALRANILRMVIQDALNKNTFPQDRLAILAYLDAKTDMLAERNRPSDVGAEFLTGPSLEPGTSTYRDVTVTVGGVEVRVTDIPPTIINADVRDVDDQNGISEITPGATNGSA